MSRPQRVNKNHPCPVCKHPDWCMVGDKFALCMRVQSDRPKTLKGGETGWLHPIDANYERPPEKSEQEKPVDIDFSVMIDNWKCLTGHGWYLRLQDELGVSWWSLRSLGACYAQRYHSVAFPMRDGRNQIVGIRLRNSDGKKWAVPGSHQGLFIAQTNVQKMMCVCEGPTDTAAALTLGYYAVGRPSCSGGVQHLCDLIDYLEIGSVMILCDLDDPGIRGAQTLQEHLNVRSAIVMLPAKDVREFVRQGGNRETLDSIANQIIWRQPFDHKLQQLKPEETPW